MLLQLNLSTLNTVKDPHTRMRRKSHSHQVRHALVAIKFSMIILYCKELVPSRLQSALAIYIRRDLSRPV